MGFVSAFMQHAEEIFAAAQTAGAEDCDLSILLHRDGGIHMIAGNDWQLESLRAHHGASEAFRVQRSPAGVRLEARSAGKSCTLSADSPARILAPACDFPRYLMLR
jgi:hypothetical protein